jgi:hypothetical protein
MKATLQYVNKEILLMELLQTTTHDLLSLELCNSFIACQQLVSCFFFRLITVGIKHNENILVCWYWFV